MHDKDLAEWGFVVGLHCVAQIVTSFEKKKFVTNILLKIIQI